LALQNWHYRSTRFDEISCDVICTVACFVLIFRIRGHSDVILLCRHYPHLRPQWRHLALSSFSASEATVTSFLLLCPRFRIRGHSDVILLCPNFRIRGHSDVILLCRHFSHLRHSAANLWRDSYQSRLADYLGTCRVYVRLTKKLQNSFPARVRLRFPGTGVARFIGLFPHQKSQIWVNFRRPGEWKMLDQFMPIWNIIRPFGVCYGCLIILQSFGYIFPRFGIFYQEKIWQPCPEARLSSDQIV
jgi:hypothetical protein